MSIPSTALEAYVLVHEVAWRCGKTKGSLGLALVSSEERIPVVGPVLPQVSP